MEKVQKWRGSGGMWGEAVEAPGETGSGERNEKRGPDEVR